MQNKGGVLSMPRRVPETERFAFTVAEFCAAHRISRAQYYQLRKLGEGPDEMLAKGKVLISVEAAERWRREREGAAAAKPPKRRKKAGGR